ncbi:AAA family ATPase [Bifidobacterium xylocopae]|uniref:Nuclease SbcCD subunit C n=1 Tax=Bifidobacterium xylocopae TaxID=2493119 RepID=A0A366KDP5_9BIFI|nr:AAA family ATPase [Bifidobacterium xylocopae]RBP99830.1 hypothetical protein CRD59_02010 [Bifidobacterium xylocopae]
MTTAMRIHSFKLSTDNGPVIYEFKKDLTVFKGTTSVGKTTLFELIKYSLGGDAEIAEVVYDHVKSVSIDITVNSDRYHISRTVRDKSHFVQVLNTNTENDYGEVPIKHDPSKGNQSTLSDILLKSMNLGSDLMVSSKRGKGKSRRLTFAGILNYIYIPQRKINNDIAESTEPYMNATRVTVFELLLSISTPEIQHLKHELSKLAENIQNLQQENASIKDFLDSTKLKTEEELKEELTRIEKEALESRHQLDAMNMDMASSFGKSTLVYSDIINQARESYSEAKQSLSSIERIIESYKTELAGLQTHQMRIEQSLDAADILAETDFTICPRCLQPLHREVKSGTCPVCMQPDTEHNGNQALKNELNEVDRQIKETESQLAALHSEHNSLVQRVKERQARYMQLEHDINRQTNDIVTPNLQMYTALNMKISSADARKNELEQQLQQWDLYKDKLLNVDRLEEHRRTTRKYLSDEQSDRLDWKQDVIGEISKEFRKNIHEFGIPDAEQLDINADTYLPTYDKHSFRDMVHGGGKITSIQMAYWLSILAVATRHWDETPYPLLLIIDTPQLALDSSSAIGKAIYRKIVSLTDVQPGRIQVVLADNDVPEIDKGNAEIITLSYEHPAVSTIHHPGPSHVTSIGKTDDDE